ncbi:MAG: hypothetical protein KatS3mg043_1082 [Rhodothermaceae bacterium]|nr:MAG: hypothetical protein KatS3mg043_1082 [Rhodothermaceae bacterium]
MCLLILKGFLKTVTTVLSQEGSALPVGIKVRDNESIDRALRRFKRAVNRSRVLRIYRANMAYTKPSEERRIAREKAARNARKRSRY